MLARLVAFEIKYQSKKGTFLLFAALLFLSGIFLTLQEGAIDADNKYNLFLFTCLISLFLVIQISFQCAYTITRDQACDLDGIIHTTRAGKYNILGSRFIGILVTSVLSSLTYVVGLFLGIYIDPLSIHDFSTFDVYSIVWPWLIIVLPDIFIILSIVFSITLILRKASFSFVAGTLIMTLFLVCNFYIGSPFTGGRLVVNDHIVERAALLDALGLCSQFKITHLWSPLEKRETLVSFSGSLLLNRIIWCFSSLGLIITVLFSHSFRIKEARRRSSSFFKRKKQENTIPDSIVAFHSVQPQDRSKYAWAYQLFHIFRMEVGAILRSRPFQIFMVVWCVMIYSAISHHVNGQGVYGKILPSTDLIIGLILEPFSYTGLFLIVYFTGLIVWRSRSARFNEIIDVTPVSNGQCLISKWASMLFIPVFLITCGIAIGVIIQISNNYYKFDIPLYLSVYAYGCISVLSIIVVSMLTQMFVSNKYIGMVVTLVLVYGLGYGLPALGYVHPLSKVFQLPKIGEGYSAFFGYGNQAYAFIKLSAVWLPLLAILCMITYKGYKRKVDDGLKHSVLNVTRRWTKLQLLSVGLLVSFSCFSATLIHREYKQGSTIVDLEEETDFRVNYERRFLKYASKDSPDFSSIKTWVDIDPKKMKFQVKGVYSITNYGDNIIDTVIVNSPIELDSFSIEGARVLALLSARKEARLVVFDPPLKHMDKRAMHFVAGEIYTDFDRQRDIQNSGTYLRNGTFEPRLGYVENFQLSSKVQRRKYQLADLVPEDCGVKKPIRSMLKQAFETWITTDAGQIAVAPGNLVEKKRMGERMMYHYQSTEKTDNNLSYFSGNYKVVRKQVEGVQVEVYTHPNHGDAVPAILDAVQATLKYATEAFGVYHYDHLRIVEVPLHWKFGGHALPGTIALNEMFIQQDSDADDSGIDQLSRVVIHELGHQWFGHKMSPASGAGANLLTESMANYMEAEVMEIMYGKDVVNQLSDFNRRRYFHFRSESHTCESSLYHVGKETYIAYRKGYVVMQGIKKLLGEEVLNNSLKMLVENFSVDQTATVDDWVSMLLASVSSDDKDLVTEWLKEVVTYDLKIIHVDTEAIENSRTKVMVDISAAKFMTLRDGSTVERSMSEDVELMITGVHRDMVQQEAFLSSIRLTGIDSMYTFAVDFVPESVILDPDITRLDDNIIDNTFIIEQ